jgi:hypothetical protein
MAEEQKYPVGGVPEQKLRDWLEGQGYPLELRTAQAFKRVGGDVSLGRYYEDKGDGPEPVPREIDVIVNFTIPAVRRGREAMAVTFVIECKSPSVPWMALTNPLPGPFPWGLVSERVHARRWTEQVRSAGLTGLAAGHIRDLAGDRVGYTLFAALTDKNRELPYRALQSAAKAAAWLAEEDERTGNPNPRPHVYFPVVVTGHELWTCHLDNDREDVTLARVETLLATRMILPGRDPSQPIMFDVVPATGLDRYAAHCAAFAEILAEFTQ